MELRVYLNENDNLSKIFRYIWTQFCANKGIKFIFSNTQQNADIVILGNNTKNIYPFYTHNFNKLTHDTAYQWQSFFKQPIAISDGEPDYWFTAFYLMNAIQEYNNPHEDKLGRFPFSASIQYYFNNTRENIVQQCFDAIANRSPFLKPYLKIQNRLSGFLLTHDIDSIYNGWKEDGKYALQNGKIYLFASLLLQAAIGKPHWLNIDKILRIEKTYGFKSVFYWILEKGFIDGLPNADYSVDAPNIKKAIRKIEIAGSKNGLHKSVKSGSLKSEWDKITDMYPNMEGSRYHFLKFKWSKACVEIDKAGITFDTSLGYAETTGFRNNYGLPFQPYDFINHKKCKFVELPLAVMDRTLQLHQNLSPESSYNNIIEFFEMNKTNCVFSILWHNMFFENYFYKGFPDVYKKILLYFYESDFKCYTQNEIMQLYST